jgi:hypothetical protein
MLSMNLPTPSMLMATPRSSRIARNSMLVNWEPWSELSEIHDSSDYAEDNTTLNNNKTA